MTRDSLCRPFGRLALIAFLGLLVVSCKRSDPGKHVIVILLDAARADRFSSYGYRRETTPNIDRLAEKGVVFLNHFAQGTDTRSSLPKLFYSRYFFVPLFPASASVPLSRPEDLFLGPDPQSISMPRAFEKQGYSTVAISSHPWLRAESAFAREFQEFHDLTSELEFPSERVYPSARQAVEYALEWMKDHFHQDVFIYLHLMDTHFPHLYEEDAEFFLPPEEVTREAVKRFTRGGWATHLLRPLLPEQKRYLDALYDGSLRSADRALGSLFSYLERRGSLEQTVIAITSDHGDHLLEHPKRFAHVGPWFDALARVPLILFYPPGLTPDRARFFSESVDLMPTLLSLTQAGLPSGKKMDGVDLCRVAAGKSQKKNHVFSERGIRSRRYKAIYSAEVFEVLRGETGGQSTLLPGDAKGALFDLEVDPLETEDRWQAYPEVALRLWEEFYLKMSPLFRRYSSTRHPGRLKLPFAISAANFRFPIPPSRVEAHSELYLGTVREYNGWKQVTHWQQSSLKSGPAAQPLPFEFPLPNGRYLVSAQVEGSGTIVFPDSADSYSALISSHEQDVVEVATIDIRDKIFRVVVQPPESGGSLIIRHFGFQPLGIGDRPSQVQSELDDKLRALGYIE